MINIDVTSRCNYSVLYLDNKTGSYWGTRQPLRLREHSTDLFYQVTDATNKRLDLIAYQYYGDVRLWWIIAEFNNIGNPLEIKSGTILRIPTYERVQMEVIR